MDFKLEHGRGRSSDSDESEDPGGPLWYWCDQEDLDAETNSDTGEQLPQVLDI